MDFPSNDQVHLWPRAIGAPGQSQIAQSAYCVEGGAMTFAGIGMAREYSY
jgi:hypothetical protein